MQKWGLVGIVVGVVACGGSSSSDPVLAVTNEAGVGITSASLGTTAVGQTSNALIHVTNQGDGPLAAITVTVAISDFKLDTAATTCIDATLAAGDDCVISVAFRPHTPGAHTSSLTISAPGAGTATVLLLGIGAEPMLSIDPASADLGVVAVGSTASTTVHVSNTGAVDATLDTIAATGTGYSVPASTCGTSLAVGATCDVVVQFLAVAPGTESGALTVTSAGVDYTTTLTAQGATTDLLFDDTDVAFSRVEANTTATQTIHLINNSGTLPAQLGMTTITGAGFTIDSACDALLLAPATQCAIDIHFTPTTIGARTGTLSIMTPSGAITAQVSGTGAQRVEVGQSSGGTVTSSPAGIACGATCIGLFTTDVELTATPAPGFTFAGWTEANCTGACDVPNCPTEVCVLPAGIAPRYVIPSYDADTTHLSLTFAGGGTGKISIARSGAGLPVITCMGSCTVPTMQGQTITLTAETPATWSGFAGDCTTTGAVSTCSYTSGASSAVTATFTKDPKDAWMLLGVGGGSAAFDGSENLIVSGSALTKLSPSGAVIWTKPYGGDVATGPGDAIYLHTGSSIVKLDASGTLLWSVPATTCPSTGIVQDRCISVRANGDVVARTNGVTVLSSSGAVLWNQPGDATWTFGSVAIASTGEVFVARFDNANAPDSTSAARFAADGSPMPDLGVVAERTATFTIDPMDRIVSGSSGFGNDYLEVTPIDGSPGFSVSRSSLAGQLWTAVAAAGTGDLAWGYVKKGGGPGFFLERVTSSGTPSWTLDRHGYGSAVGPTSGGITPLNVAASPSGRFAIVGSYQAAATGAAVGIVETFSP